MPFETGVFATGSLPGGAWILGYRWILAPTLYRRIPDTFGYTCMQIQQYVHTDTSSVSAIPEPVSGYRRHWGLTRDRPFQTEATLLLRWYRWPLLSIGEAFPTLLGGGTGPGWVSTARVAARGRCDGGPFSASAGLPRAPES